MEKKLIVYDFDLGQSVIDTVKRGNPILLAPDETITFELTEHYRDILRRVLLPRELQLSDMTKVEIWLQTIEFADNTGWFVGDPFNLDVANRRWVRQPGQ